ncbi:Globin [Habropoda laboriosa]|uniref:Globin n=1 Tax=Habropoda laboriosa TaxID=597456 RepID=A0A0L7R0Z8_9HYME|nr:PREDICTED: globin-like [Habropoda laboriosa]KOC64471.1 Globin [Habropoda laboriosa]
MGSVLTYFLGYPEDNIVDLKVGLTGREKRLVRESWSVLRVQSVNTGVAIMTSYFQQYPQYQKVFPAFKDVPLDELAASKKFQAHCQNIVSTLSNAIDALNDVDLMEAILHTAGERHGRRGQGRQEFIDLKGVIIEVMKGALKSRFSTEVEAAWNKTIDVLYLKIFEGIESSVSIDHEHK